MAIGTLGGYLLELAAEAVGPILGGIGGAVEKAIFHFGPRIVEGWVAIFRTRPSAEQTAALENLAAVPPGQALEIAREVIDRVAPEAAPEDREVAARYVAAIPAATGRTLVQDRRTGQRTLPATIIPGDPDSLLQLLPRAVPPYPVPHDLPDIRYRLEDLLGTGGFGAVYKATLLSEQYGPPRAIKFCLNPNLAKLLQKERDNLQVLIERGQTGWTNRIVRLYGYNLDYKTPFLVYEYVPGGDLTTFLVERQQKGKQLGPDDVLKLIEHIASALDFAHQLKLVHRDLKPANVLLQFEGHALKALKLADFGIGGVMASESRRRSGSDLGSRYSQLRGAGTPLYMSEEQRKGNDPDPRDDIYSLGVMWYQMLVSDVGREMPLTWADELKDNFAVPTEHIDLLKRCLLPFDKRLPSAGELLRQITRLRKEQVKTEKPRRLATVLREMPAEPPPPATVQLQIVSDPRGFLLLELVEHRLQVMLLPTLRLQFEQFLAETKAPADWYSPAKLAPSDGYEHHFVTGVYPNEALQFAHWFGADFDLPTVAEWRLIDRSLQAVPWSAQDLLKVPAEGHMGIRQVLEILHRQLHPANWGQLILFRGGVLEWVRHGKRFAALGAPRPEFLPNTFNPQHDDPVEALGDQRPADFGFRLVRRL